MMAALISSSACAMTLPGSRGRSRICTERPDLPHRVAGRHLLDLVSEVISLWPGQVD